MTPDPKDRQELTYDERATWGQCPACHAQHGEWCHDAQQSATRKGVHLGRLTAAPRYKEVRYV